MTLYEFCDANGLEPDSFSALIYFESGAAEKDFVDFAVEGGVTREEATKEWHDRGRKIIEKEVRRSIKMLQEFEFLP
jgi:hypothetical protein